MGSNCASALRCHGCDGDMCVECVPKSKKCVECDQDYCAQCAKHPMLATACGFCNAFTGEKIIDANHTSHLLASNYINCEMDRCQKCEMLVCAECMEDGDPDVSLCGRCVGRAECELCEE